VAATYLARAGLSVLLLKKNDYIGAQRLRSNLSGYDARLCGTRIWSVCFAQRSSTIWVELELRRRAIASCTPYMKHGHDARCS